MSAKGLMDLGKQQVLGNTLALMGRVADHAGIEAFGAVLASEAAQGREIDLRALAAFLEADRRFACQVARLPERTHHFAGMNPVITTPR